MYTLEEANRLKEEMLKLEKLAEIAENKYYEYIIEMEKHCSHRWEPFGYDYICKLCGKFDY